ncbi:MAG: biotin synthase BioB [Candidatus Omnitrophota bacterium]|nr:biotin synthase BioB [Candidatus Omnitrophota bacterium]
MAPAPQLKITKKNSTRLITMPLGELVNAANKVREKHIGLKLESCSIMNTKSGLCSEDCKFCAQSARHASSALTYPLKSTQEIIASAVRAKEIGAVRFCIVVSGRAASAAEVEKIITAVREIKKKVKIRICTSLGILSREQLACLQEAGVSRYHHNIETSPAYFSKICTTHSLREKIKTIKAAQAVGLEVCSGGIIGMGETWFDRISMAFLLKELNVDSIPINALVARPGTPLASLAPLACSDVIRTIAIFRLILKDKEIKLAAGREQILRDFQGLAFMAGANSMIVGGYLTIKGRAVCDDQKFIEEIKTLWAG